MRLEVWFTDESRVAQKDRLTRRWFARGQRPRGLRPAIRDTGVRAVMETDGAGACIATLSSGERLQIDATFETVLNYLAPAPMRPL